MTRRRLFAAALGIGALATAKPSSTQVPELEVQSHCIRNGSIRQIRIGQLTAGTLDLSGVNNCITCQTFTESSAITTDTLVLQ